MCHGPLSISLKLAIRVPLGRPVLHPHSFMLPKDDPHRHDLRQIHAIREVPLILDVCAKATGMGFTAIARVTEDRWITCASLDHLNFGLLPGDELEVRSTICHLWP